APPMVKLRIVDVSPKPKDGNAVDASGEIPDESLLATVQLEEAVAARMPCIIRGLSLGPCVDTWPKPERFAEFVDCPVKVHVSRDADLDFVAKNFAYKTVSLAQLVQRASRSVQPEGEYFLCPEERYYLRALGGDSRSEPAQLARQFPQLAPELRLPDQLYPSERQFSSVLRVASAGLRLWLHYDVMDNLLCGVCGTKRVTLYPPYDAEYLYLVGDKSRVANPDNYDAAEFPDFAKATPFTGDLLPGDVLYIPAMWFHSVLNVTYTLSVNVFWKTLRDELYDLKDAYGNKEPVPIARLMQSLQSGLKTVTASGLPPEYCHVYGVQLANLIRERLCDGGAGSGQDQSAAE
ncbi:hypothetical protein BOX15_Mlig018120g2, partial [Macrostomum lignano]